MRKFRLPVDKRNLLDVVAAAAFVFGFSFTDMAHRPISACFNRIRRTAAALTDSTKSLYLEGLSHEQYP